MKAVVWRSAIYRKETLLQSFTQKVLKHISLNITGDLF